MVPEFTTKEVDNKTIEISYIDFMSTDNINSLDSVKTFVKNIELTEVDNIYDTDFERLAADYLNDNVIANNQFNKISIQGLAGEILKNKIKLHLTFHSHYIASNGRIGKPNTFILNTETCNKYQNALDEFLVEHDHVVINDFIPDNVIYLVCNTEIDKPGYKFLYHNDIDNKLYYAFVGVGFYPERQASKFVIYE